MANVLKMAKVHAIQALHARGWSQRRIARELGVHRETVATYLRRAGEAAGRAPPIPAISITGAEAAQAGVRPFEPAAKAGVLPGDAAVTPAGGRAGSSAADPSDPGSGRQAPAGSASNPAISITGAAGRRSRCEPLRAVIEELLAHGLSAQRIWQDLTAEHGFGDSYQSVQRFVRKLRATAPLPFRRMECAAGEEAQVDFGRAAPVITSDGRRLRPHLFRIVLSCSRKAYSEAVERQTTETFIRCLENALRSFGGVPKTLVIDNLKAAVSQADWYDPELNPKLLAFCQHYGTVILPTRPYTPRHKGKIERGVGYAQSNALKGRTFDSLAAQNAFLLEWESGVADTRIHGTTRRQVKQAFEQVERPALQPLPLERFPFFHEARRSVHRDAHVEVDKAYYSVPPEFVGRRVWVRWDSHLVRIFDAGLRQIAVHARHSAGRFSTQAPHIAAEKIAGVERGAAWLLRKAGLIGPESARWAQAMLAQRGVHGVRALVGLVALAHRHDGQSIEQACRVAHSHGALRLRAVRALIRRQAPPQEQFEFTAEHPLIRPLSDYGRFVHTAFQETCI